MEFVKAVVQFNQEILGIEQRSPAPLSYPEFSITHKCLLEEVEELVTAHFVSDLVGCVDALVDNMYFTIGALYKLGLTPEQIHECCMAVHQANITKKKGVNAKRDTGAADATKPEGWVSPEESICKIIFGTSNA